MAEIKISLSDARNMVPDFDGNPNELDRFINCCKILFDTTEEESDKKLFLSVVKTGIIGPAYEALKHRDFKDWDTLREFLEDQFLDRRPRVTVQAELLRLKQSARESIDEFAQRLSKLLCELNNVTSKNVTDAVAKKFLLEENELNAIKTFEDGLRSEQLRVIVKSKCETTLRKLVLYASEHAIRLENFSKPSEMNKTNLTCDTCGKRGHTKNTCFRNKIIPSFHPTGPHIKREVHRLNCSYCKKPNHHRSECRTRIQDKGNRNQNTYRSNNNQTRVFPASRNIHPTPARQVRWNMLTDYGSENDQPRMEYNGDSTRVTKAVVHQNSENRSEFQ